MTGKENNLQVNLVTRIPVLIVYGTATVNEENQIRFFDDVYGYDAALDKRWLPVIPIPGKHYKTANTRIQHH